MHYRSASSSIRKWKFLNNNLLKSKQANDNLSETAQN